MAHGLRNKMYPYATGKRDEEKKWTQNTFDFQPDLSKSSTSIVLSDTDIDTSILHPRFLDHQRAIVLDTVTWNMDRISDENKWKMFESSVGK